MRTTSSITKSRRVSIIVAFALTIGIGFATVPDIAQAQTAQQIAAQGAAASTDFSAARRQRQVRRSAPPEDSNASAAQPPSRPSFGYGVGDNSSYGGG